MKILYITLSPIHFNTSATMRNRALIKGLFDSGNSIDVLTIEASNNRQYLDKSFDDSYINSINYLEKSAAYEAIKPTEDNNGVKKTLFKILRKIYYKFTIHDYTIALAKKAMKSYCPEIHYDLIISSSDPKSSHVAARNCIESGLTYDKWIQFWGDPLTLDITNSVIYPKIILKIIEKKLIDNSDKIVYVSPFTYESQIKLFQSINSRMAFSPVPYLKEKRYDTLINEYTFGYFGDYYSKIRDISTFVSVVSQMGYTSVVAGNSDYSVNEVGVTSLPRISASEVENLESKCEVLVCVLNKNGTQIPGKIYHYAATNKPIIVVLDGEYKEKMIEYLQGFNRFILVDNNPNSIRDLLVKQPWKNQIWEPSIKLSPTEIAKNFLL